MTLSDLMIDVQGKLNISISSFWFDRSFRAIIEYLLHASYSTPM